MADSREFMILFGPPGAGKGSVSPMIVEKTKCPQLSTGDMLREAVSKGTDIGKKAKAVMDAGELVSDEIVLGIIKDRIQEADCKPGAIFDGFPRTLAQAQGLDGLLGGLKGKVTKVVELAVPDALLEERICGRWIHKPSGRSYHAKNYPPKSLAAGETASKDNMKDDETGEALIQRPDDTAEALKTRLDSYHSQTAPILDHYKKIDASCVYKVDASKDLDNTLKEIKEIL